MMTPEDNALITRTGPGTPMGEMLRRYWIPALIATEIPEPDCPPVRVKLLSEHLVAFRDTSGKIGLISEFCAHRDVSLWFGRNEENGLRCAYHGWKYDVNGQCVEVPSEEPGNGFCEKVKLTSYPCIESGGVIWAYMGPLEKQPDPPSFEWTGLPADHVYVSKRWQETNYLQAVEGGVDSSHVSFLHRFDLHSDPQHRNTEGAKLTMSTKTTFDVHDTEVGLLIGARRPAESGKNYWRITQWMAPWYTLIPPYKGNALNGHAWVPMDDESCMAWSMTFHPTRPLSDEEREQMDTGAGVHVELVPGTFRPMANRGNDYLIDRKAQVENRHYSGVKGLAMQDASIQESQGTIADRSRELLVSTDTAIIMVRRKLMRALQAMEKGNNPPGLSAAAQHVRSASFLLEDNGDFLGTAREATVMRKGEPFVAL